MVCKYWIQKVRNSELRHFQGLCEHGHFYEELMRLTNCDNRKKVKDGVYSGVLFGQPDARGSVKDAFCRKWPSLFNPIVQMKCQYGHKVIAQCLQRLESNIMIDQVCGRLVSEHPHIRFTTIHDSVMTTRENSELVRELIVEEFERLGGKCRVSISGD